MGKASTADLNESYCSQLSIQKDEQLFGTATRADNWLLVSYEGPFTRKPFDESEIPLTVRDHLTRAVRHTPHTRMQMIKRLRRTGAPISLYVARTSGDQPRLYHFEFGSYDAISSIDITNLLAGSDLYSNNISRSPVYLVCTHGAHDRCCAQWGMPVFKHLSQRNDIDVWQTNHIGGHRYAANILCLPTGSMYGRVTPNTVNAIVDADDNQLVVTDSYRGRCHMEPFAQAAEYFARLESGITALYKLKVNMTNVVTDTITEVYFRTSTAALTVVVQRMPAALRTITSCNAVEESAVDQYRLLEYRTSPCQ